MTTECKNKGGRPVKYKTVDDLQKAIDAYFAECKEDKTPLTVTGLAIACDLTRQGLIEYAAKSDEFSDAIKKAKLIVENDYEISLRKYGRSGDIFGLKNFGWKDKTEQETTGSLTINVNRQLTE